MRFLRGLFDLLPWTKKHYRFVRFNQQFRGDVEWWHVFLRGWNGVSMLYDNRIENPDIDIWSDASGSWGCGALWNNQCFSLAGKRCQSKRKPQLQPKSSYVPILMDVALWGKYWGPIIRCNCDNEAVVASIKAGRAREPHMAHLLRCLLLLEARFCCIITAAHIPGHLNSQADALSRGRLSLFFSLAPQAETANSSTKSSGGGSGQAGRLDFSDLGQMVQHYLKCR